MSVALRYILVIGDVVACRQQLDAGPLCLTVEQGFEVERDGRVVVDVAREIDDGDFSVASAGTAAYMGTGASGEDEDGAR